MAKDQKKSIDKWRYRRAIASSVVVTTVLIYIGWLLIPKEYFLVTLISVGIAASIAFDRFVARKNASDGDE